MRRLIALLHLLLSCVCLLLVPFDVFGATVSVNSLTDENDSSCSDGDCSLRDAIATASSGDTINFSIFGTINLTLGELVISKNLTISGPGVSSLTIDGQANSRIFYISNDQVVNISGMTITNGRVVDDDGGGIQSRGTLSLDHVLISANHADHNVSVNTFGGGIYNMATLVITNSTLDNNVAYYSGGGIYSYFAPATISITDSIIKNNTVVSSDGSGGNLVIRAGNPATLTRVEISGGSAPTSGGGLTSDASFTLTDSLVYNNTTLGWGAGLDLYDSISGPPTFIVNNTTITGNSITVGNQVGAGVSCGLGATGSLTMNNVTISGNSTTSTNGAAGYSGTSRCHIRNSILADNIAPNAGGNSVDCHNAIDSLDYNLLGDSSSSCTIAGTVGHNLIGFSPLLSSLANNGGATRTMALQSGSPALEAGDNATCQSSDQRGAARPLDGNSDGTATCDIGAYEVSQTSQTSITSDLPDSSDVGSPVAVAVQVNCGSVTATGSVHVASGSDSCDVTLLSGSGQCNLVLSAAGDQTITATYSGDLSCRASLGTTAHTALGVAQINSNALKDGWILEKNKKSGKGGSLNSKAAAIVVGDDKSGKQYRGLLSFDTSSIPPSAQIASVQLVLAKQKITKKNPFTSLKGLVVDMKSGFFDKSDALQLGDFSAGGASKAIVTIPDTAQAGVYTVSLPDGAVALLNRSGVTQMRLRFKSATNNNNTADTVSFYSGNAAANLQPELVIKYK